MKARVWSLDVWGNEEDGWTVNDRSEIGTINLPENYKDKHVFRALMNKGFLLSWVTINDLEFEWHDYGYYVNDDTGYPLFDIEFEL